MSQALTVLGVWIAAFLTLAVFSFLFKDNPVYKFAEHLVVGLSAGYWFIILWETTFKDLIWTPLKADIGAIALLPPADEAAAGGHGLILDGIPVVLGVMMWLRFFPRAAAYARIP